MKTLLYFSLLAAGYFLLCWGLNKVRYYLIKRFGARWDNSAMYEDPFMNEISKN